jgi:hypothetical protein
MDEADEDEDDGRGSAPILTLLTVQRLSRALVDDWTERGGGTTTGLYL